MGDLLFGGALGGRQLGGLCACNGTPGLHEQPVRTWAEGCGSVCTPGCTTFVDLCATVEKCSCRRCPSSFRPVTAQPSPRYSATGERVLHASGDLVSGRDTTMCCGLCGKGALASAMHEQLPLLAHARHARAAASRCQSGIWAPSSPPPSMGPAQVLLLSWPSHAACHLHRGEAGPISGSVLLKCPRSAAGVVVLQRRTCRCSVGAAQAVGATAGSCPGAANH